MNLTTYRAPAYDIKPDFAHSQDNEVCHPCSLLEQQLAESRRDYERIAKEFATANSLLNQQTRENEALSKNRGYSLLTVGAAVAATFTGMFWALIDCCSCSKR